MLRLSESRRDKSRLFLQLLQREKKFFFSPWDWVNLVSKGGYLVLYIVGKLIPLGFRISMLEGLKVSFKRVIALHRRVSVLGTLIFSDNIHHKYDQTCYF